MDIRLILIEAFVILFAITVHEAAHAWTANRLGDPTAAAKGRVSLNPLVHIDLIGTIILPAFLIYMSVRTGGQTPVFGWAKPVPFNPYNLRHPRKDGLWISFAGPLANLTAALGAVALFQGLGFDHVRIFASQLNQPIVGLAVLLRAFVTINISLAFFNLIPVPPLDGSGILAGLLPERLAAKFDMLRPYSFILLIILIYSRLFDLIFVPVHRFIELLLS